MARTRRLTEAYEEARVVDFDDTARLVFMCDAHRGDGSLADEFTRNENTVVHALGYYFEGGYTYVELGDGDELWEYPDLRSVRYAHRRVYDAMRRFHQQDRFIRVWGNHDNALRSQAYVERHLYSVWDQRTHEQRDLFPGLKPSEAVVFRHSPTGLELLAVHGHQGDFVNDRAWLLAMVPVRYLWKHLHAFGFKSPMSPARNRRKREAIERDYVSWVITHRTALMCGHTHVYSYPRRDEPPYLNAGSCVYPTNITAIEIADGAVQLVRWGIETNAEGLLYVAKTILRGPEPLERFDARRLPAAR